MSYSNAGLKLIVSGTSGGPGIWSYSSTDAHGDVDAASFLSDAVTFGMKVGDIVFVTDTDTYATTIHGVASVSGDAATLAAALFT